MTGRLRRELKSVSELHAHIIPYHDQFKTSQAGLETSKPATNGRYFNEQKTQNSLIYIYIMRAQKQLYLHMLT